MRKPITSFHYLTQDLAHRTHEEQVRLACEAGATWIQLRLKNHSLEDWLKIAKSARQVTNEFDATLIINDSVSIAEEVNADGVHLGQEDALPIEARRILGDEKIIGYSTHSLQDVLEARNFDVDYFGLGPFRFTMTKENLHATIGLYEMKKIIQQTRTAGISKPLIAIGGIQLNDVKEILEAGAYGVAVSSGINLSPHPGNAVKDFLAQFQISNIKFQTEA